MSSTKDLYDALNTEMPLFPQPFLDYIVDSQLLSNKDILALTSVSKKESVGRNYLLRDKLTLPYNLKSKRVIRKYGTKNIKTFVKSKREFELLPDNITELEIRPWKKIKILSEDYPSKLKKLRVVGGRPLNVLPERLDVLEFLLEEDDDIDVSGTKIKKFPKGLKTLVIDYYIEIKTPLPEGLTSLYISTEFEYIGIKELPKSLKYLEVPSLGTEGPDWTNLIDQDWWFDIKLIAYHTLDELEEAGEDVKTKERVKKLSSVMIPEALTSAINSFSRWGPDWIVEILKEEQSNRAK